MDIGDGEMENVSLQEVKKIAKDICDKYFFNVPNCEEKAEETILEVSNMHDYDFVKFFTAFATMPILFYNNNKNLLLTYMYIDNALNWSLDLTKGLAETPNATIITPLIQELCQKYTNNPKRCIDSVDYLGFSHANNMTTLTYKYRSVPLSDDFVFLLHQLMENIMAQYVISRDKNQARNLVKTVKEYLNRMLKEIDTTDIDKLIKKIRNELK